MDRDDYFRILEEACCYNVENYVTDREWASLSGLSHITKTDKDSKENDWCYKDTLLKSDDQKVKSTREKNAFKILE